MCILFGVVQLHPPVLYQQMAVLHSNKIQIQIQIVVDFCVLIFIMLVIHKRIFSRSHTFLCQSLLLSTNVLNYNVNPHSSHSLPPVRPTSTRRIGPVFSHNKGYRCAKSLTQTCCSAEDSSTAPWSLLSSLHTWLSSWKR